MSCKSGSCTPINCFKPQCSQEQLVCFNHTIPVRAECGLEPAICYFHSNASGLCPFIFRGLVTLTNSCDSKCDLCYTIVNAGITSNCRLRRGDSTVVVVDNLNTIKGKAIPPEESCSNVDPSEATQDDLITITTGEIGLQLNYIIKLNGC